MRIFHGSTVVIKQPLVAAGRKMLDFGQGFYVTDIKEQAESWAERMQRIRMEDGQLCIAKQAVIDTCLAFVESYRI